MADEQTSAPLDLDSLAKFGGVVRAAPAENATPKALDLSSLAKFGGTVRDAPSGTKPIDFNSLSQFGGKVRDAEPGEGEPIRGMEAFGGKLPGVPNPPNPILGEHQPMTIGDLPSKAWQTVNTHAIQALGGATATQVYDSAIEAARQMTEKALGETSEQTEQRLPEIAKTARFATTVGRGVPQILDFMMTPLGAATGLVAGGAAGVPAAVRTAVGAGYSTFIAPKAKDAIAAAYQDPTPENVGEAVKLSAMAGLPFIKPAMDVAKAGAAKMDANIARHNLEAERLVERERRTEPPVLSQQEYAAQSAKVLADLQETHRQIDEYNALPEAERAAREREGAAVSPPVRPLADLEARAQRLARQLTDLEKLKEPTAPAAPAGITPPAVPTTTKLRSGETIKTGLAEPVPVELQGTDGQPTVQAQIEETSPGAHAVRETKTGKVLFSGDAGAVQSWLQRNRAQSPGGAGSLEALDAQYSDLIGQRARVQSQIQQIANQIENATDEQAGPLGQQARGLAQDLSVLDVHISRVQQQRAALGAPGTRGPGGVVAPYPAAGLPPEPSAPVPPSAAPPAEEIAPAPNSPKRPEVGDVFDSPLGKARVAHIAGDTVLYKPLDPTVRPRTSSISVGEYTKLTATSGVNLGGAAPAVPNNGSPVGAGAAATGPASIASKVGDRITVKPSELGIAYPGDLAHPNSELARGGIAWANSVDLSKPVHVTIDRHGALQLEDGYHRLVAAQERGEALTAEVVKVEPRTTQPPSPVAPKGTPGVNLGGAAPAVPNGGSPVVPVAAATGPEGAAAEQPAAASPSTGLPQAQTGVTGGTAVSPNSPGVTAGIQPQISELSDKPVSASQAISDSERPVSAESGGAQPEGAAAPGANAPYSYATKQEAEATHGALNWKLDPPYKGPDVLRRHDARWLGSKSGGLGLPIVTVPATTQTSGTPPQPDTVQKDSIPEGTKPVTPQIPNEPGTKYVLPTFATSPGQRGTAKPEETAPQLPHALAGAKPRYNYRDKAFTLEFESDIDKAAYISTQEKPSKQDSGYVAFARHHTGLSADEVRAHGAVVKGAIKDLAAVTPGGYQAKPATLTIPKQTIAGRPVAAPGTPAPQPAQAGEAASVQPQNAPQPTKMQESLQESLLKALQSVNRLRKQANESKSPSQKAAFERQAQQFEKQAASIQKAIDHVAKQPKPEEKPHNFAVGQHVIVTTPDERERPAVVVIEKPAAQAEAQAAAQPEAKEATAPNLADTMPADWNRWSSLQAKRGQLTDAEWNELVRLDEKFGPPASKPVSNADLAEAETRLTDSEANVIGARREYDHLQKLYELASTSRHLTLAEQDTLDASEFGKIKHSEQEEAIRKNLILAARKYDQARVSHDRALAEAAQLNPMLAYQPDAAIQKVAIPKDEEADSSLKASTESVSDAMANIAEEEKTFGPDYDYKDALADMQRELKYLSADIRDLEQASPDVMAAAREAEAKAQKLIERLGSGIEASEALAPLPDAQNPNVITAWLNEHRVSTVGKNEEIATYGNHTVYPLTDGRLVWVSNTFSPTDPSGILRQRMVAVSPTDEDLEPDFKGKESLREKLEEAIGYGELKPEARDRILKMFDRQPPPDAPAAKQWDGTPAPISQPAVEPAKAEEVAQESKAPRPTGAMAQIAARRPVEPTMADVEDASKDGLTKRQQHDMEYQEGWRALVNLRPGKEQQRILEVFDPYEWKWLPAGEYTFSRVVSPYGSGYRKADLSSHADEKLLATYPHVKPGPLTQGDLNEATKSFNADAPDVTVPMPKAVQSGMEKMNKIFSETALWRFRQTQIRNAQAQLTDWRRAYERSKEWDDLFTPALSRLLSSKDSRYNEGIDAERRQNQKLQSLADRFPDSATMESVKAEASKEMGTEESLVSYKEGWRIVKYHYKGKQPTFTVQRFDPKNWEWDASYSYAHNTNRTSADTDFKDYTKEEPLTEAKLQEQLAETRQTLKSYGKAKRTPEQIKAGEREQALPDHKPDLSKPFTYESKGEDVRYYLNFPNGEKWGPSPWQANVFGRDNVIDAWDGPKLDVENAKSYAVARWWDAGLDTLRKQRIYSGEAFDKKIHVMRDMAASIMAPAGRPRIIATQMDGDFKREYAVIPTIRSNEHIGYQIRYKDASGNWEQDHYNYESDANTYDDAIEKWLGRESANVSKYEFADPVASAIADDLDRTNKLKVDMGALAAAAAKAEESKRRRENDELPQKASITLPNKAIREMAPIFKKVIASAGKIPILHNVAIVTKKGKTQLFATDLETAVTYTLDGVSGEDSAITLPLAAIEAALKSKSKDDLKIESDGGKATLSVGPAESGAATMSVASYPELPAMTDKLGTISAPGLLDAIRATTYAISKEESRFTLNGALLQLGNGKGAMVSTDGHRLAVHEFDVSGVKGEQPPLLIMRGSLEAIAKIFAKEEGDLVLRVQKNAAGEVVHIGVEAKDGSVKVLSRKLTGNFPDWHRVLPDQATYTHKAVADRKELLGLMQQALALKERSNVIALSFRSGQIAGYKEYDGKTAKGKTPATLERIGAQTGDTGNPRIAMDAAYVADFLKSTDAPKVEILLKDTGKEPNVMILHPAGEPNSTALIMPMRNTKADFDDGLPAVAKQGTATPASPPVGPAPTPTPTGRPQADTANEASTAVHPESLQSSTANEAGTAVSPKAKFGSEQGSVPNPFDTPRFRAALDKLKEKYGDQVSYSGMGAMADVFNRNLSQVKRADRPSHAALIKAASYRARASAIMYAYSAVEKQALEDAHSPYSLAEVRLMQVESALLGKKERWEGLATGVQTASDKQILEDFDAHHADLLDAIENRAGFPGDLSQTAAALVEAGDADYLRDFLADAYESAASRVTSVMDRATFDRMREDPGVQAALEVYRSRVEPAMAEAHEAHEGVFSDAYGPLGMYYPLIPVGKTQAGGVNPRMPMVKPRNLNNRFATGLGAEYDSSAAAFKSRLTRSLRGSGRFEALKVLEERGLFYETDDKDNTYVDANEKEWPGVRETMAPSRTIIVPGQKPVHTKPRTGIMPLWLHNEIKGILDLQDRPDPAHVVTRIMTAANEIALAGIAEPLFHSVNLLGAVMQNAPFLAKALADGLRREGLSMTDFQGNIEKLARVMNMKPSASDFSRDLIEMSKYGIIPDRYGSSTYSKQEAEETGAERHLISLGPLLFGSRGIDIYARWMMYRTIKSINPEATPKEINEFVNQLGNYTASLAGTFEKAVKAIHLGPFYTAGLTMNKVAVNGWLGTGPMPKAGMGLRLLKIITTGAVGMTMLWYLLHKAVTGKYPDRKSRLGQVPITDPKYRHSKIGNALWGKGPEPGMVNITAWNPLYLRGARALGVQKGLEAWMLHGSAEQIAEGIETNLLNSWSHPLMGPAPRAAIAGGLGVEPYLTGLRDDRGQFHPQAYRALPKKTGGLAATTGWRMSAAAKELNSFYHDFAVGIGLFPPNPDEKGDQLFRVGTKLALPNVIEPTYNPGRSAAFLQKQRAAMHDTQ